MYKELAQLFIFWIKLYTITVVAIIILGWLIKVAIGAIIITGFILVFGYFINKI